MPDALWQKAATGLSSAAPAETEIAADLLRPLVSQLKGPRKITQRTSP